MPKTSFCAPNSQRKAAQNDRQVPRRCVCLFILIDCRDFLQSNHKINVQSLAHGSVLISNAARSVFVILRLHFVCAWNRSSAICYRWIYDWCNLWSKQFTEKNNATSILESSSSWLCVRLCELEDKCKWGDTQRSNHMTASYYPHMWNRK